MRFRKTRIVAFANQKGGCGKTTATVSIGAAVAVLGYSVCIVDADPQCNATDHLGISQDLLRNEGKASLADVYLAKCDALKVAIGFNERFTGDGGGLGLVAGSSGLSAIEPRLNNEIYARVAQDEKSILDEDDLRDQHRIRLRNSLESLRGVYDMVFIDTPPELGFLMTTALIAADTYVIPVFPSAYDLKGLEKLTQTAQKIRARYNPSLQLGGVLLGNFDRSTKLDSEVRQMLRETFGDEFVFQQVIRRGVRNREATFQGKTIFEHAPADPAAKQYLQLAKEMLENWDEESNASENTSKDFDVPMVVANG